MTSENQDQPPITPTPCPSPAPSEKAGEDRCWLWDWFVTNQNLHLTASELNDIIHAVGQTIKYESEPQELGKQGSISATPIKEPSEAAAHVLQNASQGWFVYFDQKPISDGWYATWVMPGVEIVDYEPHFEQAYYSVARDEWEGAAECGPLNDGCYVSHWKTVDAPSVGAGSSSIASGVSSENSPPLSATPKEEAKPVLAQRWTVEDGPRETDDTKGRARVLRGYVCKGGHRITNLIDIDSAHELRRIHNASVLPETRDTEKTLEEKEA